MGPEDNEINRMLKYIEESWDLLSRNCTALSSSSSLMDTKISQKPLMYFPQGYEIPKDENVQRVAAYLPKKIHLLGEFKRGQMEHHGLLYLPHPYVVPGGMFNEMYGWDSYFILRGLIEQGRIELAKGMVENFYFELEHYGAILNGNRSYYLTRSQPPFLTSMILPVYEKTQDKEFLANGYLYAQKDYRTWVNIEDKKAGNTNLSRFYDFGDGIVIEMNNDPEYFNSIAKELYDKKHTEYLQNVTEAKPVDYTNLTTDFFHGDRATRESGYDISDRFGYFGGSTHHFAPVCLNSLLYKAECDMATIAQLLGHSDEEVQGWKDKAEKRKQIINHLMWDEQVGEYFDYNFVKGERSTYSYLSTFFPLWVGLATDEQAKRVAESLPKFEHTFGLACSSVQTGLQWDLPWGWAPLQMIAVEGLKKYGALEDAQRIAAKFISNVLINFLEESNIKEKYDVRKGTTETKNGVIFGYKVNCIGFGWTNGVVLALLNEFKDVPGFVERIKHQRGAVQLTASTS